MARVLVVGGGFGGLAAATRLRDQLAPGDEVILVARDHRFAMGWTKIWDLVDQRPLAEGTRELGTLGDRGIRFVHAEIDMLVPDEPGVTTTAGEFAADGMVVALGANGHPDQLSMLDGVFAHDLYAFSALPAAKQALAATLEGRIAVVVTGQPFKCPPAPFEAVLALDQWLRDRGRRDDVELTIATPSPGALPVAGPDASAMVAERLRERNVDLRLEQLATAIDPTAGTVTFDGGETLEAALVFAVPGAVPPDAVADSGLAGQGGWIHPDPVRLSTDFARVYAVGDCTTVPTATAALPKAGVFAARQGEIAATNLAHDLDRCAPARFDGHGHCYLEFPGNEVAVVEGDFFAQPRPEVTMRAPDAAAFTEKLRFERELLTRWFGR